MASGEKGEIVVGEVEGDQSGEEADGVRQLYQSTEGQAKETTSSGEEREVGECTTSSRGERVRPRLAGLLPWRRPSASLFSLTFLTSAGGTLPVLSRMEI